MYEDTTVDAPGGGISRRDMLRKSAVVGGAGAMIWAAPSITKYGSAAFGSEGTPAAGYSNFGGVASGSDGDIRVKGDYNDETGSFDWEDSPGGLGGCEGAFGDTFRTVWCGATKADGGQLGFTFSSTVVNGVVHYTLRAPSGYTFVEGAASSLKQGQCCYEGAVIEGGAAVRWYGPFSNGSPCKDGNNNAGNAPASGTPCPS